MRTIERNNWDNPLLPDRDREALILGTVVSNGGTGGLDALID